jgi:membrane-associated phospholipid phosphatase
MLFLTDFADQAVVLPLVLAAAAGLAAGGWRRGALAWAAVCAATLGALGLLKLAIFVWGAPPALPGLLSPSGHTASAALVYGGIISLLALRHRRFALPVAALAAGVIGTTRLALHQHTLPDVIVGAGFGLAGVLALVGAAGKRPVDFRPGILLGLGVAVIAGFHGLRLPAEPWLHQVADALAGR